MSAAKGCIELDGITKSYREGERRREVLRGVHAVFAGGEFVAVLGRSGSGKSTLLNVIAGIDVADAGDVRIDGVTLRGLSEAERTRIRRSRIGFVFQFFNLIPTLTVAENLALPLELNGVAAAESGRRVETLLRRVGLAARARSFPDSLSGGEQQRVAVVRAVIHRPQVVLADEPTGNLDPRSGESVLTLLRDLTLERGTTVIMATHSHEAAALAHRTLLIEDGGLRAVDAVAPPQSS